MANRLSKIYTRTGDDGSTGLADGSRVDKTSSRVTAMGEVDELNSHMGLLLALGLPADIGRLLTRVQHDLFDLGGELAIPGSTVIGTERIARLEVATDACNQALGPLKEFILPGGGQGGAHAHVTRAVCRRAERALVRLSRLEAVNPQALAYVNRLSDLLFVLARHLNRAEGATETYWVKQPTTENGDKSG